MTRPFPRRRRSALLTCVALLSLAAPGLAQARSAAVSTFYGTDGLTYESAPLIMQGRKGEMFYGPELDSACGLGDRLAVPMKGISKLARIIERSGRKVVFTIVPGKTAVLRDRIGPLPHGSCDRIGLTAQNKLLDRYRDRAYLPVRRDLLGRTRQMYWKTDLHWTTVGGSQYAKALATRLSPELGRRQKFKYGHETRLGLFTDYLDIDEPETVQKARPSGRVKVRNAKGDTWPGYPEFTFYNAWRSKPRTLTWPGRTLLMGDSFLWYALENLRPIFRRGEFMWFVHTDEQLLLDGIKRADTVVIEVFQLVTAGTPIVTPAFRKKVKQTLRRGSGARVAAPRGPFPSAPAPTLEGLQ